MPSWRHRTSHGVICLLVVSLFAASSFSPPTFQRSVALRKRPPASCVKEGNTAFQAFGRPKNCVVTSARLQQRKFMPLPLFVKQDSNVRLKAAPHNVNEGRTRPVHVFRSLLTGVALLGLATAIACVTTSDPVERTLTGTFVSCIVLAAIAYKEVLFSLRSMSFGSNTYDARKVDATSASLVLSSVQQQEFDNFQRRFLVVQLLATFVDFLQGPYLYRLYENYNYDMNDIATLYLLGFCSSALSSPFAGILADMYGRRLGCMTFAVLQTASCLLLHYPSFALLAMGRVLSGIATSFLSTCFEAWMISEHNRRSFSPALLTNTFSIYVFMMGVAAVASGGVAGLAQEQGGVLAAFDVCAAAALGLAILIPLLWTEENYGRGRKWESGLRETLVEKAPTSIVDPSSVPAAAPPSTSPSWVPDSPNFLFQKAFPRGLLNILEEGKRDVVWLGLTQAFFEAAMFTWVFMWTPSLDTGEIPSLNLGLVFATLMLGVMCGSSVFRILTGGGGEGKGWKGGGGWSPETVLRGSLVLGGVMLGIASWPRLSAKWLLVLFTIFEASVGVYFAAMGSIRARIIPEEVRATVMNLIRLVLNLLVVFMYIGPVRLALPIEEKRPLVLGLCSAMIFIASVCHAQLLVGREMHDEEQKTADENISHVEGTDSHKAQ